tara:strand:+ start:209 stop:1135 length:927 start_codon:yes stop_codon:yes gene_type:complete
MINKDYNDNLNDEIDLKDIFVTIWDHKLTVINFFLFSATLSVLIALYLPNTYLSKTLLAPTSTEDTLSSQLSELSSFSSIAGINLTGKTSTKSTEAIARIQSYDFFINQFLPNIYLQDLLAVKRWNPENNTLTYKKSVFNVKTKKWSDKFLSSSSNLPSTQKAFEEYKKSLSISDDRKTSFITINIEHKSPYIAKEWLDIIIEGINNIMRMEDITKAQNSINFLNESTKIANIQSIKDAISTLLESQMKTLMLASSNDSYVFRVLDTPIVSEKKSGPARAIICILGTFIGTMLSLCFIFLNKIKKNYY